MDEKKNWYCSAPFRSTYLNDGVVKPCCWYDRKQIKNRNQSLKTLNQAFNSEEFEQIRAVAGRNQAPPGCQSCISHEAAGGKSHRMYWNQRESELWQHVPAQSQLRGLDLDMGNLCNLKCVMCNSHNSSQWISEEKRLGLPVNFDGVKRVDLSELDVKSFEDLNWLKFAGGEVLFMPEHRQLLEFLIKNDLAKQIDLVYVVNNSISPKEFRAYWTQFKSVKFFLSIDGTGDVYNYIRYPADWQEHLLNIKAYLNEPAYNVAVNTTVSIYNILHLKQLDSWWQEESAGREIFYRVLNAPKLMSIRNLPIAEKERVAKLYGDHPRLGFLAKEVFLEPLDNFENFLKFTESLEKGRSLEFAKLNPGLIP